MFLVAVVETEELMEVSWKSGEGSRVSDAFGDLVYGYLVLLSLADIEPVCLAWLSSVAVATSINLFVSTEWMWIHIFDDKKCGKTLKTQTDLNGHV